MCAITGAVAAQAPERLLEDLPRGPAAGPEAQHVEAMHRQRPRVGRRLLILVDLKAFKGI